MKRYGRGERGSEGNEEKERFGDGYVRGGGGGKGEGGKGRLSEWSVRVDEKQVISVVCVVVVCFGEVKCFWEGMFL